MVDFERLARPGVRELRAYDPGHDLVALRRRFAEVQLVELCDHGSRIEARLVGRGVVLRPMGGHGLGECLRITVGTEVENQRLLAALDEVMK